MIFVSCYDMFYGFNSDILVAGFVVLLGTGLGHV